MKEHTLITLAGAAVLTALAACSKNPPPPAQGETSASTSAAAYPLTTCVVSGEELGSMGEPVVLVHEGTTVKFCCDKCLPKFNENPGAYLAKLGQ